MTFVLNRCNEGNIVAIGHEIMSLPPDFIIIGVQSRNFNTASRSL